MYDENKAGHLPPSHRLKKIELVPEGDFLEAVERTVLGMFEEERTDFNRNPTPDHPYLDIRTINFYLSAKRADVRTGEG